MNNYVIWWIGFGTSIVGSFYPTPVKRKYQKTIEILYIFLQVIALASAFLLVTSNRIGFDITNYFNHYRDGIITLREPLFSWLKLVASTYDLPFYTFRALMTLISGLFLVLAVKKLKINICNFLIFYFPLFLFVDSMQLRNQIAIYLLVWSVFLLLQYEGLKGIVLYIFNIFLIAQIHTVYYFYILVLITKSKYRKYILFVIIVIALLLSLITVVNSNKVPFIKEFLLLILSEGDPRVLAYNTSGRFGFLIPTSFLLVMTGIIGYFSTLIHKNYFNNYENKFINYVNTINVITFLLIPFTMMNMNYYRFMRNSFLFDVLACIVIIRKIPINQVSSCVLIFCFLGVLAGWCWFDILVYNTDSYGIPIFDTVLKYGQMFWENV